MNRNAIFFFLIIVACSILLINGVHAKHNYTTESILFTKKVDLTNDGKEETIQLKGIPFSGGGSYYKETELIVLLANGNRIQTTLTGGKSGTVEIKDLNGDKRKDLLIKIPIDPEKDTYEYFLYSVKNNKLMEWPIPKPVYVEGHFDHHYNALIKVNNHATYQKINLSKHKKTYENLGIYHHGILNEPREVMVSDYLDLSPVRMKNGKFGIKGVQKVFGPIENDAIATVTSIWSYHPKKEWMLEKTSLHIE
jgi:hypothetical protein